MSILIRKCNRTNSLREPPEGASRFFLALDPIFIDLLNLSEGDRIEGKIKEVKSAAGEITELVNRKLSLIVGPVPTDLYITEDNWNSLLGGKGYGTWDLSFEAELEEIRKEDEKIEIFPDE